VSSDPPIRARTTPWRTVLLLCGKCARKLDGGFGATGKDPLRRALREALRQAGRRREVRIIETRCMGICPKRAVTALNAGRPDRLLTVPEGTPIVDVLAALADWKGT
jgi:predicted metal-binding protein